MGADPPATHFQRTSVLVMNSQSFTGRTRRRTTRWTVHLADHAARWLIVAGGIGTIVAVSMVCIFLVWVVAPLFLPAAVRSEQQSTPDWAGEAAQSGQAPLHVGMAEDQLLGYSLEHDGSIISFRPDKGFLVSRQDFLKDTPPTAIALSHSGTRGVFGFADGTARLAQIVFVNAFPEEAGLPENVQRLRVGESIVYDEGIVTRTPAGQLRLEKLVAELEAPIALAGSSPIRLIDYSVRPTGEMFCVLSDDGHLQLHSVEKRENLLTGETISDVTGSELPLAAPAGKAAPDYLALSGGGDHVYVAWKDGTLLHFDTHDFDHPKLAETVDLLPEADQTLTALTFLLGKTTLLAGDSTGQVQAWFCVKSAAAASGEKAHLVPAHTLPGRGQPVSALAPSANSRLLAIGYADRSVRLFYPTNQRLVLETSAAGNGSLDRLALAPADNGLLGLAGRELIHWTIDPKYPETNFRSLFLPIWYEDNRAPEFVWQSGSGSAGAEPKLSLVPLIFGTLKATFYSMLFGVPLALCAALYTSEFMRPQLKAKIKPSIEMMASLPSVVLGFLAGAVVAPFVEHSIPMVLCSFFTIPFALLAGAYLWQMLPQRLSLLVVRWRLTLIFAMLPLGMLLAALIAPAVERHWFGGDMRAWLDGQVGTGTGGWMFLLLPCAGLFVGWLVLQRVNPYLRRTFHGWTRKRWTAIDLVNFLLGTGATVLLAWLAAAALDGLGFDPRGRVPADLETGQAAMGIMGTYIQRNALIVGFVMGFAVIPIIYTIADDALAMVPDHLRSASLGAGATPWQTAMRIIVPTAMSGLFSAVMIGLGRAVGETMIVLMAAGNTPIMDWNVFNGFQTLSSLIAQEMPESVRDSTHYRTLFLAALTLFALTFVVNSVAEIIRLRFRRRAYEL
jgi:phosphate transport system permease protein